VWLIARLGAIALVVLALRGKRWAYAGFVVVSLLYFPARVGFHLQPQACELAPTFQLAVFSLQKRLTSSSSARSMDCRGSSSVALAEPPLPGLRWRCWLWARSSRSPRD
jgi:hypothetical protein